MLSLRRKLVYSAVCLAMVLGLLEVFAWVADGVWHYRDSVLRILEEGRVIDGPIPAQPDEFLELPPRTIWVRVPFRGTPSGQPYEAGGRVIPDTELGMELCQDRVTPEDLAAREGPEEMGTGSARPRDKGGASDEHAVPVPISSGRKRIFIIGESAAFGFPYRYERTQAALLDEALRPRGYAVYNGSVCAWTSGRLVPLATRMVDHFEPHALVISCGNNEWLHWSIGDIPYQQMLDESWANQARLRAWRQASRSRALAAVEYLAIEREARRQVAARNPPDGRFPKLVDAQYALDHPLEEYYQPTLDWWNDAREGYLTAFETNLREIVRHARDRGVRVILLTMPFNYKLCPAWACPQPESLDPAHGAEVRAAIGKAAGLIRRGEHSAALPLLEAAIQLDPRPPILHHLRAQCLEAAGRMLDAEQAYAACRENMIGHLGCRLSVNETIRRVAKSAGGELLDVAAILDDYEHAHGKYFNEDMLHDDCHPTPLAHGLIAEALAERFGRAEK